jgi:tetratricopeptide (TPR) repeat protein
MLLAACSLLAAVLLLAACEPDAGVRIIAMTATPRSGGVAPIAATGTPRPNATSTAAPVELPARPDNPLAGGLAVGRYLAGGLADLERCLPELVHAWELSEVEGERCVQLDLDGDRREEVVFLVTLPGEPQPPADAWFFDDSEARYRLLSSARALANASLSGLVLVGSEDLTGDGSPEVVMTSETCGAHTCVSELLVASYHRGILENLAPEGSGLESMESIEIADADGDGFRDIMMRGGVTNSVGAGPQRGLTRTLSWTGIRFARFDTPESPTYLVHLIADADAAYRTGDLKTAIERYTQAARDTSLRDWKAESGELEGRGELVPYAWFRAGMAAQRQGDGDAALTYIERAAGHSTSLHGIAAAAYLRAITTGKQPQAACAEAEQYLQRFADAFQRVWDYGYANPEHTIAGFCR